MSNNFKIIFGIIIYIILFIVAVMLFFYVLNGLDTASKISIVIALFGMVITIYSSIISLFQKGRNVNINKEIKETERQYEERIATTADIKIVNEELTNEAQELMTYLKNKLINSDLSKEYRAELNEALKLYEDGKFRLAIVQVGFTLEKCVNEMLEKLNKKHMIKLSKSKQKKMGLAEKIGYLFSKRKISSADLSKLDIIRKYRNISVHMSSKKESIEISKNARTVIDFGIEIIEKLQIILNTGDKND